MGKISSFTLVMIVLIAGVVGFVSVEPAVEEASAATPPTPYVVFGNVMNDTSPVDGANVTLSVHNITSGNTSEPMYNFTSTGGDFTLNIGNAVNGTNDTFPFGTGDEIWVNVTGDIQSNDTITITGTDPQDLGTFYLNWTAPPTPIVYDAFGTVLNDTAPIVGANVTLRVHNITSSNTSEPLYDLTNASGDFSINIGDAINGTNDTFAFEAGDELWINITGDSQVNDTITITGTHPQDLGTFYLNWTPPPAPTPLNITLRSTTGMQIIAVAAENLENISTAWEMALDIEDKTDMQVVTISGFDNGWVDFIYRNSNGDNLSQFHTSTDYALEIGVGYMVSLRDPGSVVDTMWETEWLPPTAPATLVLDPGWNNVGVIYTDGTYNQSTDIVGGNIIDAAAWDDNAWVPYNIPPWTDVQQQGAGGLSEVFADDQNAHGFFVKASITYTWVQE